MARTRDGAGFAADVAAEGISRAVRDALGAQPGDPVTRAAFRAWRQSATVAEKLDFVLDWIGRATHWQEDATDDPATAGGKPAR